MPSKEMLKNPGSDSLPHEFAPWQPERPHVCSFCGRAFALKHHLKNHTATHTKLKPFACRLCERAFARTSQLKEHAATHTVGAPCCELCGRCFDSRAALRRHSQAHSEIRPYQCETCGAAFKDRHDLARHARVHTGARPFGCGMCFQLFATKSNAVAHMALHAEVKQFVCDECGRAFRQRVALQIHTRSHRCGRLRGASAAELSAMAEAREKRAESLTAADGLGRFKIVCWACAEPFGSQRALRQHATAVHAAKSGLGWEPGLSSLGSFNLPRSGI